MPPPALGYEKRPSLYPFNPSRAKTLLAQAGFSQGKGFPSLKLWITAPPEEAQREGEMIAQYLRDVGLQVTPAYNTDWPSFQKAAYTGQMLLFRYSWNAAAPDPLYFFYNLFHSKSRSNYLRYKNPTVDDLLDRAEREQDPAQRLSLYKKLEDVIIEDAPVIFLIHRMYNRAFQQYVKGIVVNAQSDPYIPMRKIWLDRRPAR